MLEKIRNDLKEALKAGDKKVVNVLRGVLASVQNAEIAKRGSLEDQEIINLLQKESKKRTEAAEIYEKAGAAERKDIELEEKTIIDAYLPEQISDQELQNAVAKAVSEVQPSGMADMGRVIGLVKQSVGTGADGARIANAVKTNLTKG